MTTTISVLYQPVVEIITDADGSNPRLGGVDWCDSFTLSQWSDTGEPTDNLDEVVQAAERNAGVWIDRRYRFANRLLTLALRRPVLRKGA